MQTSSRRKEQDKTFISVNMDHLMRERLNKLATLYGKSRASTCRHIFEDYMRWYESKNGEIR
jgi:predicted DNA-binding protein